MAGLFNAGLNLGEQAGWEGDELSAQGDTLTRGGEFFLEQHFQAQIAHAGDQEVVVHDQFAPALIDTIHDGAKGPVSLSQPLEERVSQQGAGSMGVFEEMGQGHKPVAGQMEPGDGRELFEGGDGNSLERDHDPFGEVSIEEGLRRGVRR